ncbi:CoA transferase [Streptomyces sp. GC420]|uniref:CoA transferase n=1 Tax=Streptomyces sp. GC420 TaxID=2697568 RepID=UPI001414EE55|nr:CoA transferase [Streptomyces sp. GC420]NBM14196.1 2-methylfumaryl-CoA isomerase [Streptomyces sp. GC420]
MTDARHTTVSRADALHGSSASAGDRYEAHRPGPLSGLRVVEVSSFVATPLCGLTLAQLGADVIRVEPLGGGPDRTRWPLTADGASLYWNGLNPGKRAVEVDLADPRGRRLVAELVVGGGPAGGILVTNVGRWDELTYRSLSSRRADVIRVQLMGRYDGGTAVDYTVQAGTGFPLITGPEGHGAPVNHVLPAWDLAAGLYLATGLLAAELRRRATGRGAEVRVALEDVALATAGQLGHLAQAQLRPEEERRADGNFVYGTFGTDFVTADGQRFMLVALTPRQWADLLQVTGLSATVDALGKALGADFADEGDRYRHRRVLAGLVAEWFARHDADQVREVLATTRLLWSPYRGFADLVADDASLLREHPLFETADQPGIGPLLVPGSPVTLDGRRGRAAPAPAVGQHTRQVLTEEGGLSTAEFDELVALGVVRRPAPREAAG